MKIQLTCATQYRLQQALRSLLLASEFHTPFPSDMTREKSRLGRVDGMNCGLQVPKMWLEMQSALAVVILVA